MDMEWKEQVLEKLKKVNELVVQVQRVADALERIVLSETYCKETALFPSLNCIATLQSSLSLFKYY